MSNVLIVDDQDASIQYTGHWNTAGQLADFSQTASAGSSGDSMSFSFSGNSVSVVGDLYAGGTCSATFSIDGAVTNFTSSPTNNTLYQQTLWSSSTLNDGNHTLVYTVSSCDSSQSFVWLDYLLYNSSNLSVTGATSFFDDSNAGIIYSGTRNSTLEDNAFRGTITSMEQGSSFQFTFNGTSVQVYGQVANTTGQVTQASFSVDGSPPVPFTAITSGILVPNKKLYASRPLNAGQHKLSFSNMGNTPVSVDYILVRGSTSVVAQTPGNSSSPRHHSIYVLVGSIVGGLCATLILVALSVFLIRSRRKFVNSRSKNATPPTAATDLMDAVAAHRPRFVPQGSNASVLVWDSTSSSELHPLTHRRQRQSQAEYDTTSSSDHLSEALQVRYQPDEYPSSHLSREGSQMSFLNPLSSQHSHRSRLLPNQYSSRHSHRSRFSDSSFGYSVADQSQTLETMPCTHNSTMSEDSTSLSYGYGSRGFTTTSQLRGTLPLHLTHTTDDEDLSVEDLKRREDHLFILSVEGMTTVPLVHTDSGIRLHSAAPSVDPEFQPELPPLYTAQ